MKEEPYDADTDDDDDSLPLSVVSAQVAVKGEAFDEDTDDEGAGKVGSVTLRKRTANEIVWECGRNAYILLVGKVLTRQRGRGATTQRIPGWK